MTTVSALPTYAGDVSEAILGRLGSAFGATHVRLVSLEPGSQTLRAWTDSRAATNGDLRDLPPLGPLEQFLSGWLTSTITSDSAAETTVGASGDWSVIVLPVRGRTRMQAIVAARPRRPWTSSDVATLELLIDVATDQARASEIDTNIQSRLDDLVTRTATDLMAASVATSEEALATVVRDLCTFFAVDTAFLRRNDETIESTVLVAEWPVRDNIPNPDPLGIVPFVGADPVFAATRYLTEPLVIRPDPVTEDYQRRVKEASNVDGVSMVCVPLVNNNVTLGVLGFIKFGDREWFRSELNALRAIASLITQLRGRIEAETEVHYTAYHDELTGLPNRRYFLEHLAEQTSRADTTKIALLFFDLDRLKAMNDFLGHAAGDRLICEVANRLRSNAGETDFVARLGGDEFVVVVDKSNGADEALATAERWLLALNEHIDVDDQPIHRSASVGVAVAIPGEITASDLLLHADVALLDAKGRGGNVAVAFDEAMREKIQWRADLELHLRDAIESNDLLLHYQPEIDLITGKLHSVEALVRWQHATRGMLMPDTFIDVVEETNQAVELGRWVINEACRQAALWRAQYPQMADLGMRVNVSPAQLISHDIVGLVAGTLSRYGLPASALCLEITERLVVRDLDRALAIMHDLQAIGVSFAIDDFGTGYSSLTQLKALPVDTLKIDRSFVGGLGEDDGDRAIVESIAQLANAFGMALVAEGVETKMQAQELVRLGVRRAQGFLISRPLPPDELAPLLEAGIAAIPI